MRLGDVGTFVGGLAAGASSALGAVKIMLVNPLESRLDDVEEEQEEIGEIAEEARDQAVSNRFTLEGDPNDPNYDGLAQDVAEMKAEQSEIKETVDHVEEIMEEVRDDG